MARARARPRAWFWEGGNGYIDESRGRSNDGSRGNRRWRSASRANLGEGGQRGNIGMLVGWWLEFASDWCKCKGRGPSFGLGGTKVSIMMLKR